MCTPLPTVNTMGRKLKSAIAAVVIAASSVDVSFALPDAPAPITRSVLEQSVQTLEAATSRSEVIQSLADVFEAAGTKTLLVRTKYKYVSNCLTKHHGLFDFSKYILTSIPLTFHPIESSAHRERDQR